MQIVLLEPSERLENIRTSLLFNPIIGHAVTEDAAAEPDRIRMTMTDAADAARRRRGAKGGPGGAGSPPDPGGSPPRMERRRLNVPQRLLAALLTHTSSAVVCADAEGRIAASNDAAARMFGYGPDDLIGYPLESLFPQERQAEAAEILERARAGDPTVLWPTRCRRADGLPLEAEISCTLVRGEGGEPLGFSVIVRDVSGRRRAEMERDRFFSLSPDLLCVAGLDGRLKRLNPAWEKTLGYAAGDLLDVPYTRIVHPDDLDQAFAEIGRLAAGRDVVHFEHRLFRKDGSTRWILLNATPDLGQQVFYAVGRDVTGRKQVEDRLREAQRLESVGALAGGVAHEINNLMTVVLGYGNLILERLDQGDPIRRDLREVVTAGERAAAVTQQLLAFGRKQMLQPILLDINGVIAGMERAVRRLAGDGIDLVLALAPDLHGVIADPDQMRQVILNLVSNARDAMPAGGTLTIETANAEAEVAGAEACRVTGRRVRLVVRDTGHGMDAATRARVFDPFFTTREVGQGTGLGLATVYGIVEQSGGHIVVESDPGRGAAFTIHLPAAPAQVEAAPPVPSPGGPPRGTETVLIVEEEAVVRAVVREILTASGYTVLEARDAAEGLRICEEHRDAIDLVVADVVMPGMSGREFVRRAASLRPAMKVLYVSGYTDGVMGEGGAPGTGADLLLKPFSAVALARKVREVLDRRG